MVFNAVFNSISVISQKPVHLSMLSGNSFNPFPHNDTFLMPLGNKPFENTVGKGEIARNEQFLLFPQCFLPIWNNFLPFSSNLKLSSANSFSLEESKICRLVMGQPVLCTIFFPSHWLLSHITKIETRDSGETYISMMFYSYINPFPNNKF